MRGYDAGRWLLLATLWSLQFLFMRMAVPVLGSPLVAKMRALFAVAFVVPWALVAAQRIAPLAHWRDHVAIALTNNVLPFFLMAWAAGTLPAGYLAIINGTVPLWTGLFAAALIGERLGGRRLAGFALGIAGVALIVNLGPVALGPGTFLAAGAASRSGCSAAGVAYLPFFTLVRDIGPSRTLSVTFLVPLLGVLWGWLFLGEAVTAGVLVGAALVLGALGLVLRR